MPNGSGWTSASRQHERGIDQPLRFSAALADGSVVSFDRVGRQVEESVLA